MSKLKFHITLLITLFYTAVFSQDRPYIYFDDLNSEAIEYSNDGDYKLTTFYIYSRGYETKKKRDSINQAQIKRRNENRNKLFPPTPSSGLNFISTDPPEKLSSLEGIKTISPKEYRENRIQGINFIL